MPDPKDITITVKVTVPHRNTEQALEVAKAIATDAKANADHRSKSARIIFVKVEG